MKHVMRFVSPANCGALVVILGLLLGGSSCYVAPGGPDYASIKLKITDSEGHSSESVCTVLPVLLGSRSQNTVSFAGSLQVKVFASSEGAELSFSGAQDTNRLNRFISAEVLREGLEETVTVNTRDARVLSLFISSGCRE